MNRTLDPSVYIGGDVWSNDARSAQWKHVDVVRSIPSVAIDILERVRRRFRLALRSRLAVQMIPCAAVTFFIAQWCGAQVGDARLQAFVITFAWSAAVVHQLLTSRPTERVQPFKWSLDLILSGLGGQMLWVVLPGLQFANPDAWYSMLLKIPPALTATGAILALCWTLHPFVMRRRTPNATARCSELDGPVLYGSFFLFSGQPIFAAAACASVIALSARQMRWAEMTREWTGRVVSKNTLKS